VLTSVPKLGLVPDVGATWFLPRLAGRARTMAASLLGDAISAEEAERWGLVARLYDDASLQAEAMAICRRLADGPQRAVVGTRQLVDAAPQMPIGSHILLERDIQVKLVGSPEHAEHAGLSREASGGSPSPERPVRQAGPGSTEPIRQSGGSGRARAPQPRAVRG
jgi:2-(1,2-epoxy-1,2-dihydrophenyl)acetyl-CoA isomerase